MKATSLRPVGHGAAILRRGGGGDSWTVHRDGGRAEAGACCTVCSCRRWQLRRHSVVNWSATESRIAWFGPRQLKAFALPPSYNQPACSGGSGHCQQQGGIPCTWRWWSEGPSSSDSLPLQPQQDNFVEKQETLRQIREDLEKTHKVETTSRIPGPGSVASVARLCSVTQVFTSCPPGTKMTLTCRPPRL